MADIMRLSRPWLGASMRPATLSPLQILIRPHHRHFTTSITRLAKRTRRGGGGDTTTSSRSRTALKRNSLAMENSKTFLLPSMVFLLISLYLCFSLLFWT